MDYDSVYASTCPIWFDVMSPKESDENDGRVQVDIGFFFKNREKGEERGFHKYDDYATIYLDREVIESDLPKAADLDSLLLGKHLRVEELDGMNPFQHIRGKVGPTAGKRDECKLQLEKAVKEIYYASTGTNKKDKCREVVNYLLGDGEVSKKFKEFIKYAALQRLLI